MTKVAQIFEREKQEAVETAVTKLLLEKEEAIREKEEAIKQTSILKLLLKGDSLTSITAKTGVSEEEIQELIK